LKNQTDDESRLMQANSHLYGILDLGYTAEKNAEATTAALLAGGVDILQLRAKNHDLATIERVALTLIPLCRAAGIPFILNDFPALAAAIGADGVHIGQDDGSLAEAHETVARQKAGKTEVALPHSFLYGRSTHSLSQARAALAEGFDYIGFGPLFPTPTKAGRPAIGLDDVILMEQEIGSQIPAYCIGGITPATLPQVLAAGARRVVVVSALLQAPDIQAATRQVRESLSNAQIHSHPGRG
jgi:thiamine-phosphate pyrophosphorylase